MATQATWYENDPDSRGSGYVTEIIEDPCRVRAFPNEDICLWVKTIDNSRVVRPKDPHLLEACWRMISVASLVVIVVLGLLLPNAYAMLEGYKLHKLERERDTLLREQASLELEESRLLSPQRLEELARMQEFVDPAPSRVVQLRPQDDHSLAMNTGATH